jgi:uncharacterized protein YqgC (DUF456 family)
MTVDAIVGSLPLLVAFALLVAGVVGSILPAVPGAPLSVAGVLVFWWATDDIGPLLLVALVAVGVLALAVDWFGGAVAAKASGTSTLVSAVAGVVGLIGMVLGGPLGLIVGIAGTVFVATYVEERETGKSLRRALYTTAGVLASAVVQGLLTASILLTVLFVYLI